MRLQSIRGCPDLRDIELRGKWEMNIIGHQVKCIDDIAIG